MRDVSRTRPPLREGTITKLVIQDKNPDRVSVFLDEAFAFGLYQDVVLAYGLQVGKTLKVEEQVRLVEADQLLVAKAKALRYVAYRARTEHEVRQKLQQGGFGEAAVAHAVERLRDLSYLDDAAYARDYVQGRLGNRGYGPERIRSELIRRGVDRPLIEAALEEGFAAVDTLDVALRQAEKRWARLAKEPDVYKRRKKLSDFLLRRGFGYDTVRRVVAELERNA